MISQTSTAKSGRPVLQFRLRIIDILFETISTVTIAGALLFVFVYYPLLPDLIPIHFDAQFKPDDFGPKELSLALVIFHLLTYVGLSVLTKFPQVYNYPWPITQANAEAQYSLARIMIRWIKILIGLIFCCIYYNATAVSLAYLTLTNTWLIPWICILMLVSVFMYLILSYMKK